MYHYNLVLTEQQQQWTSKTAYEKFADGETVDVGLIIAGKGDATHIGNLITIAENRKDAVVFASPERSDVVGVADANTQKSNVVLTSLTNSIIILCSV